VFSCSTKESRESAPPEIPVYEIESSNIPVEVDFVGQTYGYFDIAIRARVEGFLEGRHFNEGSDVKKGQLLYTIDPQPFQAKVAEQESRLAQAKTSQVRTNADLNRIRPLAEKNAVSQRDLDAAVANYEAAIAEVDAARASLRAANIELGYTKIYSPIDGIIGITEAKRGDFVGREPNPVVLNAVSRIDTILVRFSITEAQYLRLSRFERVQRTTQRVRNADPVIEDDELVLDLILADGTVHDQKGKVDFGDRNVDPNTGTLLLQASFANPEKLIRPGQFARIIAHIGTLENGIMVPQRCVNEIQGIYQVLVVDENDEVEVRQVKTSFKKGNMWVIEEGLKAGERIVLEGIQQARSGMKIVPVETEFEFIDS
jgi:membrane fusion protein (multidrug efflux system)